MQLEKACCPCGVGGSHVARSLPYEGYPASDLLRYGQVCVARVFVLCRVVCTVSDRDFDFTIFVNATTANAFSTILNKN